VETWPEDVTWDEKYALANSENEEQSSTLRGCKIYLSHIIERFYCSTASSTIGGMQLNYCYHSLGGCNNELVVLRHIHLFLLLVIRSGHVARMGEKKNV
jgi:hypothetical protein